MSYRSFLLDVSRLMQNSKRSARDALFEATFERAKLGSKVQRVTDSSRERSRYIADRIADTHAGKRSPYTRRVRTSTRKTNKVSAEWNVLAAAVRCERSMPRRMPRAHAENLIRTLYNFPSQSSSARKEATFREGDHAIGIKINPTMCLSVSGTTSHDRRGIPTQATAFSFIGSAFARLKKHDFALETFERTSFRLAAQFFAFSAVINDSRSKPLEMASRSREAFARA